jgi:hypothetical protein
MSRESLIDVIRLDQCTTSRLTIARSKIIGELQMFSHMAGIEWVSRPCIPSFS